MLFMVTQIMVTPNMVIHLGENASPVASLGSWLEAVFGQIVENCRPEKQDDANPEIPAARCRKGSQKYIPEDDEDKAYIDY